MSHDRMIIMLKRPGAVRIVVLPPALDGQPRKYGFGFFFPHLFSHDTISYAFLLKKTWLSSLL